MWIPILGRNLLSFIDKDKLKEHLASDKKLTYFKAFK